MGTGDNPVKEMERYGKRKSVSVDKYFGKRFLLS